MRRRHADGPNRADHRCRLSNTNGQPIGPLCRKLPSLGRARGRCLIGANLRSAVAPKSPNQSGPFDRIAHDPVAQRGRLRCRRTRNLPVGDIHADRRKARQIKPSFQVGDDYSPGAHRHRPAYRCGHAGHRRVCIGFAAAIAGRGNPIKSRVLPVLQYSPTTRPSCDQHIPWPKGVPSSINRDRPAPTRQRAVIQHTVTPLAAMRCPHGGLQNAA